MAFSVSGDGAATVKKGAYHTFAAADIALTDGDSDDLIEITTLPSNGTLEYDGAPVTALDTFLPTNITKLIYYHGGGSGSSDTFTVKGVPMTDGVAGTKTGASTITMTISASSGWACIVDPLNAPPFVAGWWTLKRTADRAKVVAEGMNIRAASVVEVSTTSIDFSGYMTKDSNMPLNSLGSTLKVKNSNNHIVTVMYRRLLGTLLESANNDIEAIVKSYGADVEIVPADVFTVAQRTRWNTIRNALSSGTRDEWLEAIALVAAALP